MTSTQLIAAVREALATPLGSLPHRPLFGSNLHEYADRPPRVAVPLIVAEAHRVAAVLAPEGARITVTALAPDPREPGRLVLRLSIRTPSGVETLFDTPLV